MPQQPRLPNNHGRPHHLRWLHAKLAHLPLPKCETPAPHLHPPPRHRHRQTTDPQQHWSLTPLAYSLADDDAGNLAHHQTLASPPIPSTSSRVNAACLAFALPTAFSALQLLGFPPTRATFSLATACARLAVPTTLHPPPNLDSHPVHVPFSLATAAVAFQRRHHLLPQRP